MQSINGKENQLDDDLQNTEFTKKLEEIKLSEKLRDVTFVEKVKFVYSYFNKQNAWEESCLESTKSSKKSVEFREAGNTFFRNGRLRDALRLYTESVAMAFPNSVELSLAFANRSAALSQLGNCSACLRDVNRSLNLECPQSVREKLLKRKEACLIKMEGENQLLRNFSTDFKCDSDEIESHNFFKLGLKLQELKVEETEPSNRLCTMPIARYENNLMRPFTNAKTALKYDSTYGYHFIASQDIHPGEIIAHEKAFSSILDRNFRLTNCSFCFVKEDALIPCEGCSLVLFCGENCRNDAYNTYHRVECEIAAFLREAADEFPYHHFLPLRTLLVGSEQGRKIAQLRKDPELSNVLENKQQLVDEKEKIQTNYAATCNLHRDFDKLPETVLLGFCMKSSCFVHWLKHSSFFTDQYSRDLTDEQASVGTLLLNHFVTLVFNAFSVTETVIPTVDRELANCIGVCMYALCSRFNHSCDPNADFYSNKNSLIIYSHRPISSGEQVFISYETHYHSAPLPKRRTSLSQYGFVCQCRACKGDWPLYVDLPCKPTLLRNINETKISMTKLYEKYEDMWSGDMMLEVPEALLRFLYEFSTIIHQNFQAPLQLQIACQSDIGKLISTTGNFYIDCHDIENYANLLHEYFTEKTDVERLRCWIHDFLVSS